MNTKLVSGIAVAALILAVVACFLPIGGGSIVERVIDKNVGGSAGPVNYDRNYFLSGLTAGGTISTTTTATTYTTNIKDFAGTPSVIEWTPNADITLSISATSTFNYIPNIGDVATVIIHNASTTSGAITFAAADAGVDLLKDEDVADLVCAAKDYCELKLIRRTAYIVGVLYTNWIAAD